MTPLIDSPRLKALTMPEERVELVSIFAKTSLEARLKAAEVRGRKIIFAFFQSDFKGGRVAYWHVTRPDSKSYHSTLSMEGLHDWKVI